MKLHQPIVKNARSISPVWIIPLVALVIAAWLSIRSWQERGQEIEIIFDNASGIEVGQTQIRLKDVPVGKVTKVTLSADLSKVRVFATLDRQVSQYLSENSRFWLVSPRVSATGVSNLGTLISGVYIVMEPGKPGSFHTLFKGLDEPPAIQSDDQGTQYILLADTLGSLDIGSPVYYKQLKVGEVTGYKLGEQGSNIEIRVFVEAPYDKLILTRTRFWNVSGFSFSLDAGGVKANMASIASLLSGGVTFDSALGFEERRWAQSDHKFYLYPDRASVVDGRYNLKYFYRLNYSHTVRGLKVGAPVEFRGIKVGQVEDIVLEQVGNEPESLKVYISVEPQRLDSQVQPTRKEFDQQVKTLVDLGLKAQLKSSSFITGSRFVDLVFSDSKTKTEAFEVKENYSVIPTLDHPMEQLDAEMSQLLAQINAIPFEEIGKDASGSLASLNEMLAEFNKRGTVEKFDTTFANISDATAKLPLVLSEMTTTLEQLTLTMKSLDATVSPDSGTQYELQETLKATRRTADSLKLLIEKLNQKPDALIFGNGKEN